MHSQAVFFALLAIAGVHCTHQSFLKVLPQSHYNVAFRGVPNVITKSLSYVYPQTSATTEVRYDGFAPSWYSSAYDYPAWRSDILYDDKPISKNVVTNIMPNTVSNTVSNNVPVAINNNYPLVNNWANTYPLVNSYPLVNTYPVLNAGYATGGASASVQSVQNSNPSVVDFRV